MLFRPRFDTGPLLDLDPGRGQPDRGTRLFDSGDKLETKTIVVEEASKQTFGGFAQGFPAQQINSLEHTIRESSEKILQAVERQKGNG